MTATPWGDAERLRERKLPPGPGRSQETVLANQRERLMAATVAVVAERGYEAARVEDFLQTAGVSRNAFYKQFSSKRDCFLATLEEIAGFAKPTVIDVVAKTPGSWESKLRALLDALAAVIVAQPAMARLAWIEVYAAGPEAVAVVERIDRSIEHVVSRELKRSPEHAGVPRDIVRAVVGAVRRMVHTRIREDRIDELPALMPQLLEWMQSYHTPPERLRRPRRIPDELVSPTEQPFEARDRIVAAVTELMAEQGYQEMAITEIAARGGVSLTTFYQHFEGKEAAFLAALEDAQRRLFEGMLPHVTAAPDWETGASVGARAFLAFLSSNPAIAELGGVGVWATSPAGFELGARGSRLFRTFIDEGFRFHPDTPRIASEAVGSSIDALLFACLRDRGAARLYEAAPAIAYLILAPFVGNERAGQLANMELADLLGAGAPEASG